MVFFLGISLASNVDVIVASAAPLFLVELRLFSNMINLHND